MVYHDRPGRALLKREALFRQATVRVHTGQHAMRDAPPPYRASRRELLSMFFDMLLILAAVIMWFVASATIVGIAIIN